MNAILSAWGLAAATVQFHAERENRIYRAEADGQTYALRCHRPGLRTRPQIEAELSWMVSLAERGLPVPRPVKPLVVEGEGRLWSLISWLPGEPLGHGQDALCLPDPVQTFAALGHLIGQLHGQPIRQGLDRPSWTAEELLGEEPLWGRFWEHPDLTREAQKAVLAFREQARVRLCDLDLPVQLIHADLLQENVLVNGPQVFAIDFDDSAYSYPLFDLTAPLVQRLPDPRFAVFREALLGGYPGPVDREALALVFAIRCLTYLGWIMDKMDNPGGQAASKRILGRALAQIEAWTAGRSPILQNRGAPDGL